MTTQFSVAGIELELARYPKDQESNLQAWDAADEHLIKHLIETEQTPVVTAIINDNFGALTACLRSIAPTWPLMVETDAKTSLLGNLQNLATNNLSSEGIEWLNSREALPEQIELVLMKLPKNLTYFAHQLNRLSQVLPKGTQVLISAKAKSINKSVLELIGKNLGSASASLTWKKTRVITCISDGEIRSLPKEMQWSVPRLNLEIRNLSNVFAANKLDIGAEIMLENMPKGDFKSIIDLGCGNGILGLHAKQLFPQAYIHFVDDSEMAIESAKQNWALNKLDTQGLVGEQATFGWDDCLTHMSEGVRPDLVLCNPPFHQGEAITDHIAWQMFLQSWRALKNGGILHVVGNRHLAYHIKLQRIFKNCTTVASNGKFVILQAQKISKKAEPFETHPTEAEAKVEVTESKPHPQSSLYGTKK
ncbi:methyltransferase [Shewanella woodyi]|uniref:Ribosomal RNA large subunit methyltransferase G n=1 Tax=Shewanella woodyi (strain ATCC 51908 / MS32) TaxID=392500 RepID=RLMG_SHEWM|nr:methyltransferase [Shewanella woodyi]B1KD54.1 RecName: Full=Ribosomal RNA large subunit methyltransferase G; AltName: Full=23S rRNA m2G1835 methyltransferase; AltName: Full=rRNA (guanine-N(2)-)-methyltransferase RlmG [Shewanella woodyi ATCC 51908]ACA87889.1 rRNA (guanine-N(2)-)-methyltransferase [Shewanella woodyi ATCC 51908]